MTLEQTHRLALALPSTAEAPHFADTSFRVALVNARPSRGGPLLRQAWARKAPNRLLAAQRNGAAD